MAQENDPFTDSGGWHPDPTGKPQLRFFSGYVWTDWVHPLTSALNPPTEAGWWPDPLSLQRARYFDGQSWTDSVRPLVTPSPPVPIVDPPAPAAVTPVSPLVPQTSEARKFSLSDDASPSTDASGSSPASENWFTGSGPQGIPRWVFGVVGMLFAIIFGVVLIQALDDQPVARGGGSSSSSGGAARPAEPSAVFTPAAVEALIERTLPGWSVRSSEINPKSMAVSILIVEPSPGAAQYGEFAAVLRYSDSSSTQLATESAYLTDLVSQFRQAYFYEFRAIKCDNIAIIAPNAGVTMFEQEMPSGVRCR